MTPYEDLWLETLEELRNCPEISVSGDRGAVIDELLGDARTAVDEIAEDYELHLGSVLPSCYLRFTALGGYWETTGDLPFVAGEFAIASLERELEEPPPELGWPDPPPDGLPPLSELRAIDGTPESGVGTLTAIRIEPGADAPEIWFDDGPRGARRMDIGYHGYLEALRATKGTFGWQYLFTDVSLRGGELGTTGKRLETMLRVLPDLFPGHDYSPLRRRLAERLR